MPSRVAPFLAALALVLCASLADAAEPRKAKGYHCERKAEPGKADATDGKPITSRKECKKAGGKWTRTSAPAPAPAAEATDVEDDEEEEEVAPLEPPPPPTATATATGAGTGTGTAP